MRLKADDKVALVEAEDISTSARRIIVPAGTVGEVIEDGTSSIHGKSLMDAHRI